MNEMKDTRRLLPTCVCRVGQRICGKQAVAVYTVPEARRFQIPVCKWHDKTWGKFAHVRTVHASIR